MALTLLLAALRSPGLVCAGRQLLKCRQIFREGDAGLEHGFSLAAIQSVRGVALEL